MNIFIPDSWLKEYVQTSLEPEKLAQAVSLCGPSFERVYQIEEEAVYEIEVTTNRVDAMSVKGMAREVAAILDVPMVKSKYQDVDWLNEQLEDKVLPLPKVEVATDRINKIVTVVLDQVKNQASPAWMQKRLRQIDQNSHGIIIDVTNYITHELGHPCHAFDYDKVMKLGGVIKIKIAQKGKKFITLDGEGYQTVGGEVVFENDQGEIIDLPAIKGTANTAIDENTNRVLFWLENMEAMAVRRASMSHAIRTVAAVLNEKNVDPSLMEETLVAGVKMLTELAEAKVASEVWQYENKEKKPIKLINLNLDRLDSYLGVEIIEKQVEKILLSLGFEIEKSEKRQWQVRPASFRSYDITMEVDVIEEVARIYGYHRLPSKIDFSLVKIKKQTEVYFTLEKKFKQFLAAWGLSEVYTYSMVAQNQLEKDGNQYLKISNPLSEENVFMRQSLIPSLSQVVAENKLKMSQSRGVFELAKIYFPGEKQDKVVEETVLAIVTTLPYREARAMIEQMLALAYIKIEINSQGEILIGEEIVGKVIMLENQYVAWEMQMAKIGVQARTYPQVELKSQYPAIVEDLTFELNNLAVGDIMKKMRKANEMLIEVILKDIYQQNYTFTCVYQSMEGVLKSEQIAPVRKKVVAMVEKLGGKLVGKLSEETKEKK